MGKTAAGAEATSDFLPVSPLTLLAGAGRQVGNHDHLTTGMV